MGVVMGPPASVCEPLNAAFLVTVEDLETGLTGDAELPAPNTPSKAWSLPLKQGESVTYVSGTMCFQRSNT
jgi:hypothetical protein